MRRRNQCLRCQKTTAHRSDVCVACGGQLMALASWHDRYTRPTTLAILALLILLTLLAIAYADSFVLLFTEWYLDMAVTPELVS